MEKGFVGYTPLVSEVIQSTSKREPTQDATNDVLPCTIYMQVPFKKFK
jgi:hypothetical protein